MSNYIKMTAEYDGTEFTRAYRISDVADSIASDADGVKNAIKAFNASLSGGTSGGLDDFFRADDYDATDPNNVVGKLKKISAAQIVSEEVTNINLDTEGDASNG